MFVSIAWGMATMIKVIAFLVISFIPHNTVEVTRPVKPTVKQKKVHRMFFKDIKREIKKLKLESPYRKDRPVPLYYLDPIYPLDLKNFC